MELKEQVAKMTINELGSLIAKDWKKPYFEAVPYMSAIQQISSGMYGMDSWNSVVAYFLSNAQQWQGDVARAVKFELKNRLKWDNMNRKE